MTSNIQPIERKNLLILANKIILDHKDYLPGIEATEVEQKDGILIFRGEFFLNPQGLPTAKTTTVFNIFKYLAQTLSQHYTLIT